MYVVPQPCSADTFVSAAVSVVFPWSTCPIVPTFTWGFVRSNFAWAMVSRSLSFHFRHNLFCLSLWPFLIVTELHAVDRAALAHRAQRGRIAEHLRQRHGRGDDLRAGALGHAADLSASGREIPNHITHVVGGGEIGRASCRERV